MDTILRVKFDKNTVNVKKEPLSEYKGLGGRGLTSMIIAKEVPHSCHPLSADNKLIFAPGLVTGSYASTSGRLSVGCKSPLTGGIKESNVGGQAGQYLARLGYAAIVLEGKPEEGKMYKIFINKNNVDVTEAEELKGLTNYQVAGKIRENYGDKVALISIGTAGEMKMAAASIAVTDPEFRPTRHAGRGGVGAVMGAKGVKAIILDMSDCPVREPIDKEKFKKANKEFVEGLRKHPVTGEALPSYGTNVLTNIVNEAGALPTYNFKQGKFDEASKISGETYAELEKTRGGNPTHGCHTGCAIRCSGIYVDESGKYVTKQPEYETVWAHGANCGISDPDIIAKIDAVEDDIGLDTIEMGATFGVAMEAGVLEFGDGEGILKLLDEIKKGSAMGRILGNGALITGKVFGVERIPVVKGQALPAYDPRAAKGIGVTYATSTMGADHTAGYAIASNILKVGGEVDPLKIEGQVELSKNLQIATAALDCTGFCLFIAFAILDQEETFNAMIEIINGLYGWNLTADDVTALGKKVLEAERDFNFKAGFSKKDDRLPDFFVKELLPPHNTTFDISEEEMQKVFEF
jgi:aldehyde:ferredoxin oxidoreductase